ELPCYLINQTLDITLPKNRTDEKWTRTIRFNQTNVNDKIHEKPIFSNREHLHVIDLCPFNYRFFIRKPVILTL
ncbi:MAG: hypothetical protein ACK5CO_02525, partial [Bacteroidota bacterium]